MDRINKMRAELDEQERKLKNDEKEKTIQKIFGNEKEFTAAMFFERVGDFEWDDIRGDYDGPYGHFCVYGKIDGETEVYVEFDTCVDEDDYWNDETEDPHRDVMEDFQNVLDSLKRTPDKIIEYSIDEYNTVEFHLN